MLKEYQDICNLLVEERERVKQRFKEYDGSYLGCYFQYFV